MLSKDYITNLLATNDKAIARALLVVNGNQTADEQVQETVKYQNGMGFRPCHAKMGTSMAQFFARRGYLSPKQIAYWRKTDKTGSMRIAIYWRQLAEAAEAKSATVKHTVSAPVAIATVKAPPAPKATVGDVGNLCEEQMALEEELASYQEGAMGEGAYQDMRVKRIFDRLMQIKEELEEINRCEYKMQRDLAL